MLCGKPFVPPRSRPARPAARREHAVGPHETGSPTRWARCGARLSAALALAAGCVIAVAGPALAAGSPPGAPGANATWNESNVTGFADSLGSGSKVWYTLGDGELENIFYPETDTPDTFGLQYLVTDGSSFTSSETAGTSHVISLADPTSLAWQQVNTATNGDFTITKTYIADPCRSVVLIQTTSTTSAPPRSSSTRTTCRS